MMRHFSIALAATLAAWNLVTPCRSQDPAPPNEVRIARLVRQLGSDNHRQRENAESELAKIGRQGEPHLSEAVNSDDPEVQLRAASLLKQLRLNQLWGATTINYATQDASIVDVLAEFAHQTGNQVLVGEDYGNFNDRAVSLDLTGQTFWQSLDAACRLSQNHVRPHYNPRQPGLVLVAGDVGQNPVAYSGPIRAQLTSARRVFIEQFDYETSQSEITHTFQLNLQMMWEDRFRLVAYRSQPELVAAITDTGQELAGTQPGGTGWNVAGAGIRQLTSSLRLHPPAAEAKVLSTFKLRWGLIAVGDMTTLEMENPVTGARYHRDDVEVVIESVDARPGGRFVYNLLVARDLIVPDPEEVLLHENEVSLVDEQGRAFTVQGQTNLLADRGAQIKLTFQAPEEDAQPALLTLRYPRIRDRRNVEIVFRDVPLPVMRPE